VLPVVVFIVFDYFVDLAFFCIYELRVDLGQVVWSGQRFLGHSTDRLADGQLVALLALRKVKLKPFPFLLLVVEQRKLANQVRLQHTSLRVCSYAQVVLLRLSLLDWNYIVCCCRLRR
jgi:hypothetical protein